MSSYQHISVRPRWRSRSPAQILEVLRESLPWVKRLAYAGAIAYALVLIVQFTYPRDRTLPFMYAGLGLAGVSTEELGAQLEKLNDTRFKVGIQGSGAEIDVPAAQRQLLDYSWGQRLVPFSLLHRAGNDLPASIPVRLVQPAPAVVTPAAAAIASNQFQVSNQTFTETIQKWLSDYPALKASVSIQEISNVSIPGTSRQASVNGDTLMNTASVYKLYLAAFTLKQIESGTLNPATPLANGRDINKCIELMIVNSDNACGEALGYKLGWAKLNNYTKSLGLTTSKLHVTPLQSTANDSVKFLAQLNAGTLLSQSNTELLLSYMGRQTYRKGIPAGTPSATVYDKPGWDTSISNDVAIVRSPNANYILAIYTNSQTSLPLQDLSGRITTLFSQ